MYKFVKPVACFGIFCLALSLICGGACGDVNQSQKAQPSHPAFDQSEKPDFAKDGDQQGPRDMKSQNGTPDGRKSPPDFAQNTEFRERIIADLKEQGADTTELQAAFESGDSEKIQNAMNTIREKYPMRPRNETMSGAPDDRNTRGDTDRMERDRDKNQVSSGTAQTTGSAAQPAEPEPSPTKSPVSLIPIFMGIVSGGVIAGRYLKR